MSEPGRRKTLGAHSVSGVFVFCLVGMFAVLAVTLTLVGFRAYRSVSDASVQNSEGQIALSYLLHKVHGAADVKLASRDGVSLLCLGEDIHGQRYETRIYFLDGRLWEYFCPEDDPFDAEWGEAIADLTDLTIRAEGPRMLLAEAVQPNGERQRLHIALRTGEVGR